MECRRRDQKHDNCRPIVEACCRSTASLRDKALLSMTYLTGARINEVCQVMRDDIEIDETMIRVKLICSKRRDVSFPVYRIVPIIISKESPISDPLVAYIRMIKFPGKLMFPGERQAQKIVKRMTGHGCHCLRHSRTTELVRRYNFDAVKLQRFHGWAGTSEAGRYAHLNDRDLINSMEAIS